MDEKCSKPRARGEACDAANICQLDLNCVAGKCVDPARVGDTCVKDARFPCGPFNLRCDRPTNTCQPQIAAKIGEPCGVIDDYPSQCAFGGSCRSERPNQNGVCVPAIPDGGRCGTFWWTSSGGCLPGSGCFEDVCRPYSTSDCSKPGVVP